MGRILTVIISVCVIVAVLAYYQADTTTNNTQPVNTEESQNTNTNETTMTEQKDFLENNKNNEGIIVTESGLQYEVLETAPEGESPVLTSIVQVHYHGTTIDGNVFDSSVERGVPAEFPLGAVIEGWQEGLQLMKVGEKFKFYIPAELGYGDYSPSPAIPAGATLIFEVELLAIK